MDNERGSDSDYRLPRTAVPSRYAVRVAPNLDTGSFEGDVAIELTVTEPSREIVLNALELSLSGASLRPAGAAAGRDEAPLEIALDRERERALFSAQESVEPGDYVLSCSFRGTLDERLHGLYRSTFRDTDGVERALCSTHFEATDARRAFPCFDEPDLKAVFSISLDAPEELFCISNSPVREVTPLGGGRRRVTFSDTMKMSTYLAAYAVGPFEATEPVTAAGVPLRVVTPVGKLHLTSFALEAASHALEWYQEYFALPYPGEKLDLVALPDFSMGAMENLGCVTFREAYLLCDEENASIVELSHIAEVIEHEIAHMWFGDLVTMSWWNGIWLNEAFATFMATSCLDAFRPEWRSWMTFGTDKNVALVTDGLHATRAIEYPVRAPDEADAMFDSLTYLKGGNVLRMLEQYLGTERFRDGVRAYLRAHEYSNAETTDLWDSIEAVSEGEPVRAVLDSWVFQGGHPLVSASLDSGRLRLRSDPFAYLPDDARPAGSPLSAIGADWLVPVLLEERPGERATALLGPPPHGSNPLLLDVGDGLPVVNAGGSGTYRLRYEGRLRDRLVAAMGSLEPLERFNLVADTWACTLAGSSSLADFVSLVARLGGEEDPNLWGVVSSALALLDYAAAGGAEGVLADFVRAVARPELDRLGWEVRPQDTPEQLRTRAIFIRLLGTLGADGDIRQHAVELFRDSRGATAGSALPPSIAEAVLEVVVYSGWRGDFEMVREAYRHPTDPVSERRHLFALSVVTDPVLASEVLSMCSGEIRNQDVHYVLRAMMRSRSTGPEAWRYAVEHWDELAARLPQHAMPTIFSGISSLVQLDENGSPLFLEETRQVATERDFGGRRRLADQALERQLINSRFVVAQRPYIAELLEKA